MKIKADKEYYRKAYQHLQKNKMAFCYGENGEFITIGKCKKELGLDNCMICDKELVNGECSECEEMVKCL